MPDTKDPKGANRAADAAPEGGKKKPPIMIIAIVAVVVVAAAMFMVGKVSAKGAAVPEKKKVELGPVMPLDEFLVNLADPGGDHFLKITINLELDKSKGKTAESLKEQVAVIRDAIITSLSDKTRDDICPSAGREKLKAEIKKRVNAALGEDDVSGVYITNIVSQ